MSLQLLIDETGNFTDASGKAIILRGINVAADAKLPARPFTPSQQKAGDDFYDTKVSFVGSPFPLEEADEHFARIKAWGFNTIRYIYTWEALEHEGPGNYDEEFIEYTIAVLRKIGEHGMFAFMDPHQDVWSRFTGGSGAPLWTLYAAGLDPRHCMTTQSALVQNLWENPSKFPKMIWSTNYQKLACQVMFTLFFAGNHFAPKCIINGVNIQDYLQGCFLAAKKHLAERIAEDQHLVENVVIGWESVNEPNHGLIGYENINEIPDSQKLRLGPTPTAFECMRTGMGETVEVDNYEFGPFGATKNGSVVIEPKGTLAWLKDFSKWDEVYGWTRGPEWQPAMCIWAQHGVWDPKTGQLLKPTYFNDGHEFQGVGTKIDEEVWVNKYFLGYWLAFLKTIRQVNKDWLVLMQAPVMQVPPDLVNHPEFNDKRIVYSPHYYDGLTLMNKKWNRLYNVDVVGILRGRYPSIVLGLRVGESAIRNCLRDQLRFLRKEGLQKIGNFPCLISEIGIPYDMDDKYAYRTGDYSQQIRALDANQYALEGSKLHYTLWVYTASNNHKWGDNWNGEDLSLYSKDDAAKQLQKNGGATQTLSNGSGEGSQSSEETPPPTYTSYASYYLDSSYLGKTSIGKTIKGRVSSLKGAIRRRNKTAAVPLSSHGDAFKPPPEYVLGARAGEAFIRPCPQTISGKLDSYGFDLQKSVFTLKIKGAACGEQDKCEGKLLPTTIYLPHYHFLQWATGVSTSSGKWDYDEDSQILTWWHYEGPQQLQVKGNIRFLTDYIDTANNISSSQCRSQ
ncbi:putative glycosyl hydrolase [Yarrowia sp. C11]|nr:putative glycosyl hydrolase [Yarrowia sp. C11]